MARRDLIQSTPGAVTASRLGDDEGGTEKEDQVGSSLGRRGRGAWGQGPGVGTDRHRDSRGQP